MEAIAPEEQQGFASISVHSWRQFDEVEIRFHPRLTVLTGANASGKTTILNVLGQHFRWQAQLLAVPAKGNSSEWSVDSRVELRDTNRIGQLVYKNGHTAPLTINSTPSAAEYNLTIEGLQSVPGVFVSSHRNLSRYQTLQTIPAQFSRSDVVYDQYFQEVWARYAGSYSPKNPLTAMKEALIAAALYGQASESVEPNAEAKAVWADYQAALRKVLPPEIGFERLIVRSPEVLVATGAGEFLIDAVSGGISSIMELTWQLLLRSQRNESFTACLDEPENHLHPSLQRSLIPGLLDAFPSISFVVASHSPFIVTSVKDSLVYVLEPSAGGRITSRLLDQASKSASADDTLQRVLGMTSTIPLWVEGALQEAIDALETDGSTAQNLRRLQNAMREMGLQDQFPAAVNALGRDADA